MTSRPAVVKYGEHPRIVPGTPCEPCGAITSRPETDHCHAHGLVRGIVCCACNTRLSIIDRRITPRVGAPLLRALIALRNRCPECDEIDASDLADPADGVISPRYAASMDPDVGRWVPSDRVRLKWRDLIDGVMAKGEHLGVLRSGKPVAVIVSVGWYESAMATLGEAQQ